MKPKLWMSWYVKMGILGGTYVEMLSWGWGPNTGIRACIFFFLKSTCSLILNCVNPPQEEPKGMLILEVLVSRMVRYKNVCYASSQFVVFHYNSQIKLEHPHTNYYVIWKILWFQLLLFATFSEEMCVSEQLFNLTYTVLYLVSGLFSCSCQNYASFNHVW